MSEVYAGMARFSQMMCLMSAYCEMGQQVTNSFGKIENTLTQMDWHLFPIETQRMMPMLLMVAQQPLEFMGYGNFSATRDIMKKVAQILNLQMLTSFFNQSLFPSRF